MSFSSKCHSVELDGETAKWTQVRTFPMKNRQPDLEKMITPRGAELREVSEI